MKYTFDELRDAYLNEQMNNGLNLLGYELNINKFKNFFNTKEGKVSILNKTTTEDIIDSLQYNINNSGIKSRKTAKRYVSNIADFLKYVIDNTHYNFSLLEGDFAASNKSENSYNYKIKKFIENNKELKKVDPKDPVTPEKLLSIINDCNTTLDNNKKIVNSKIDKNIYDEIKVALIIKLIALTGVMYRVIRTIEYKPNELRNNVIIINNFSIQLPVKFSDQLSKYNNMLLGISSTNKKRPYLFVEHDLSQLNFKVDTNEKMLEAFTERADVTGLIKRTIIDLIDKGVAESTIRKLTKAGETIYSDCENNVTINIFERTNNLLNIEIRNLEIFKRL